MLCREDNPPGWVSHYETGMNQTARNHFHTHVGRPPMNTKPNIRIFFTSLVFLAAITFIAAPAQAGHQSRSYQQSNHGFSVSFGNSNLYGYCGTYQPRSRFYSGYQIRYPSHFGRRSYYNGHHQRRSHASRGHYRGHNRGHSSRGRRGRGHGRGHH